MGKDKKILIVLVIILVAVLARKSGFFTGAGVDVPVRERHAVSDGGVGGGARGDSQAALRLSSGVPEVRLAQLGRARPPYTGIEKNIFAPLMFRPSRPVASSPAPTPAPVVVVAPTPEPPTPLTVFTRAVKFMGFMEKARERTVFLTSGEDVYLVKKGDMIGGKFLVTVITDTEMRFRDPERGEDAFIELPVE